MNFRCPFGHVEPDPRHPGQMRPIVHKARNRCSIYVKLREQGKVDVFGRAMPGVRLDEAAPTSSPPFIDAGPAAEAQQTQPHGVGETAATTPGLSPPADRPTADKKEGLLKRLKSGLAVRYNTVTTTPQSVEGLAAEQQDWEVTEQTSIQFWRTIIGFIGTVCGLLTGWLEIPPVPKEVFELDPGQEFAFKTALRGFTTNLLKKVFRAKSPEDADMIVAGLSGVLGFGMMAMKIAIHFMMHAPKSPKLAKWRERAAAAKKERAKKKAEALAAEGKEVPEQLRQLAAGAA